MKKFKFKQKFFLVFLGILASFILLEVFLRVYGYFYSSRNLPHYNFIESDKDARYIFCFGDSFTYGIGAGFKNSYPAQMEKMLNAKNDGKKYRVYNFGIPGDDSAQTRNKVKKIVLKWKIKPDAVIVMTGMNDIRYFNVPNCGEALEKLFSFIRNLRSLRLIMILNENMEDKIKKIISAKKQDNYPDKAIYPGPNVMTCIMKGNLCRDHGDYKKANLYYQKALEMTPQNRLALLEMGRCYKLKGEYKKAIDMFISMVRLNPDDPPPYAELEDVFIKQNMIAEPVDFYESLFREFPGNRQIKDHLARAYRDFANWLLYFYQNDAKMSLLSLLYHEKADALIRQDKSKPGNLAQEQRINALLANDYKVEDIVTMRKNWDSAVGSMNKIGESGGTGAGDSAVRKFFKKNCLLNMLIISQAIVHKRCFDNLSEIVKDCRARKIKVIFAEYPREGTFLYPVRKIAYISNIPLVMCSPKFKNLLKNNALDKYFIPDGHCTAEGYRVMAETITEEVLKILE